MSDSSTRFDPASFVREAYAIADRMDLAGWEALFAHDGTFTDESVGITYRGPGEWSYPVRNYGTAFGDMHRELYNLWTLGDTVIVQLALQGTHSGPLETPLGTIPPTGRRMDAPCADLFELEDGKIKRFDSFPQASVILTQLGVISNPGAAVAREVEADSCRRRRSAVRPGDEGSVVVPGPPGPFAPSPCPHRSHRRRRLASRDQGVSLG